MNCYLCGSSDSCLPYGENRQYICYDCAHESPERTKRAMAYMSERMEPIARRIASDLGITYADNREQMLRLAALEAAVPGLRIMGVLSPGVSPKTLFSRPTFAPLFGEHSRCTCSFCQSERQRREASN